ncbi:hypothetical protein BH10PSE17_BH10PSE17_26310 [soil metagenome]
MGAYSSFGWVAAALIWGALFVPPIWMILVKSGHRGAWALLFFVPIVNILALWVFAFRRWPTTRD